MTKGPIPLSKMCLKCHVEKPMTEFHVANVGRHKYNRASRCKECLKPERKKHQENIQRWRRLVLDHYGRRCVCCSEDIEDLLTLDHINNDGKHEPKSRRAGVYLYKYVVDNGYPNTFQILCWNCNVGKHRNGGICPHQMRPIIVESGC